MDIAKNVRQKNIVDTLEARGCYPLAEEFRIVLADKTTRRKSKVEAITIAAEVRDKLEKIGKNLLAVKAGSGIMDMADLLDAEFDRLEDKVAKILTEYLEFKSNQDSELSQPEVEVVPEIKEVKPEEDFKSNNIEEKKEQPDIEEER